MSFNLADIVSKIASQGKNPDVSFLKDNPEAQAMLLLAILSSSQKAGENKSLKNSDIFNKEKKASSTPGKVGRKPVISDDEDSDNPKSKRKAQNRAAQRAFRERKEGQVRILEEKVKELEALNSEKNQSLLLENQKLKDTIKKLQDENKALLGSTVSFDVPLSSRMSGDDQRRPSKIKRHNPESSLETSPMFTQIDSLSSGNSNVSKSGSNTPETEQFLSLLSTSNLDEVTINDILKTSGLPSDALIDHSSLLNLSNNKFDLSASQLDSLLQQQNFNFEVNPEQFDFFYPLDTKVPFIEPTLTLAESTAIEDNFANNYNQVNHDNFNCSYSFSSSTSSSPSNPDDKEDLPDLSQTYDNLSYQFNLNYFDIDSLCTEMQEKAQCKDYVYDKGLNTCVKEQNLFDQ